MKHASLSLLLAMLAAWTPRAALAKAPIVRIAITGAGLSSPIQVTVPHILDLNYWGVGSAESVTSEPAQGSAYYELAFYEEVAKNDIRKSYVEYYYPSSSGRRGVIYQPGKGVVWVLNIGTVYRPEVDGKWMYASQSWDTAWNQTIRPLISRSVTPALRSEVAIDTWAKPQSGWLYVLDPRSDPNVPGSRIWLVDPGTGKVMGSVRAGYDPDFALSPDGKRLYIASGERESGDLSVIDTATGKLRHFAFKDRALYKPWYQGLPPFASMAIAYDGRELWNAGQHVFSPTKAETRLWTFDTRRETFLNTEVDLGNCGYGDFVLSADPNQFDFACDGFIARPNRVQFVQVNGQHQALRTVTEIPWGGKCGLADAFFSANAAKMVLVRNDGAIYEMDTAARQFRPTDVTGTCGAWTVAHARWPVSGDGAKVFLGYGGVAPDGVSAAAELRAFDTGTWKELGRVRTSVPFWSAAVNRDGSQIYAVAPAQHRVLVIDGSSMTETRTIEVGNTPSTVIIAP